jgi:hypothetical protein
MRLLIAAALALGLAGSANASSFDLFSGISLFAFAKERDAKERAQVASSNLMTAERELLGKPKPEPLKIADFKREEPRKAPGPVFEPVRENPVGGIETPGHAGEPPRGGDPKPTLPPTVTAVPLPAGLPLLLVALGGLVAFGRRRRAA